MHGAWSRSNCRLGRKAPTVLKFAVPTRCGRRSHRSTGSVTPWNPNSRSRPRPFCGGRLSAGFPTFRRRHFRSITQRPRRPSVRPFVGRFAQSPDAGVLKRLANVVLEPPNPFNPNARRRPKQGAVILGRADLRSTRVGFLLQHHRGCEVTICMEPRTESRLNRLLQQRRGHRPLGLHSRPDPG